MNSIDYLAARVAPLQAAVAALQAKEPPAGGGGGIFTNKSGSNLTLGAVVIGDKDNDKAFKTTTRDNDSRVKGVLGAAINDQASGVVLTGPQLATVLVQGNVARGDWLVTSTTAGRCKSGGKIKPRFSVGLAQTGYAGGGAGSVEALLDVERLAEGWTPANLTALKLWYDASAITGKNDGDAISSWPDLSGIGTGKGLDQATGGNQPLYKVNIVNGLPVVRFDGGNDYLTETGYQQAGGAISVFVVANRTGTPGAVYKLIFSCATTGSRGFSRNPGNNYEFQNSVGSIVDGATDATFVLLEAVMASGSSVFYRNGASIGSNAGNWPNDTLRAGANQVPGDYWPGDIAEIIVCETQLGITERQEAEEYLRVKYALW